MAVPGENPVAADDVPSAVQTAYRQEVNVALYASADAQSVTAA